MLVSDGLEVVLSQLIACRTAKGNKIVWKEETDRYIHISSLLFLTKELLRFGRVFFCYCFFLLVLTNAT